MPWGRPRPRSLAGHRDDMIKGVGMGGGEVGGKRKPRSTSAYGRPGGQPGSFGARRLHGFRKRNPGGRPLRVKPFTLQTPHQSVYHQYPIDHLLSLCNSNINAIAVRAQYRSGSNFNCCRKIGVGLSFRAIFSRGKRGATWNRRMEKRSGQWGPCPGYGS